MATRASKSKTRKSKRRGGFGRAMFLTAAAVALVRWYQRPLPPPRSADGAPMSLLIDEFLPQAEFCGAVSTTIHAPAPAIFAAFAQVTLAEMPLAKLLGELRYLPGRLTGEMPPAQDNVSQEPFLKLVQSGGANLVLGERPNQEIVLGAIGKFHDPVNQQPVRLQTPDEFKQFTAPDYQKLAMSVYVTPLPDGTGYRLTLEHRTHALSEAARSKFALYWLAIKPGGNLVSWLMLRAIKRRAETSTTPIDTTAAVATGEHPLQ